MMMRRSEQGFTIFEMLFATFLSAMIGIVIFEVSRLGDQQINERNTRMTIQDSAREGLYKMIQEIRQSSPSRITINSAGTQIDFSVPDPTALVVAATYAVNWTSAHTIRYALGGTGGTQLIRTDVTTGLQSVLGNDATSISFSGDSSQPNVVTITMSVQRTAANGRLIPETPLQMTAQAEVRNT